MNLYDLALSEDEFERRKNTKYELKKALKGAGYASANDKKYVKTLMFDLLRNQYKVNERNINYAIPFDNKDKLTGTPTSFYDLDAATNGLQKSDTSRWQYTWVRHPYS